MSTELKCNSLGFDLRLRSSCTIHILSDKELLIVPPTPKPDWLWKFDLISKQFSKWYEYPNDENIEFKHHSSALSDDKSKLYIFGDPGYLITV